MFHRPAGYFAETLPTPQNLGDMEAHVETLRASLNSGASGSAYLASSEISLEFQVSRLKIDTAAIDASCETAVENYLRNLVAPGRLRVICEMWEEHTHLDINAAAEDIVALHEVEPSIAHALLRFDFGEAWQIATQEHNDNAELLEYSIPQVLGVALLAHVLEIAEALASQIHRPTGFPALDQLDLDSSGSTLRVGTLCKRVADEVETARRVIASYIPSYKLSDRSGCTPTTSFDARTTRLLRNLGLLRRAKQEFKILSKAHGGNLDTYLDANMQNLNVICDRISAEMDSLKAGQHHNRVYGNIGRTSPTALLFIVVEDALSFLREPPEGNPWVLQQIACRTGLSAKRESLSTLPQSSPISEMKAEVDNLFAAYRFAVLRDNEAVPKEFRKISRRQTPGKRWNNPEQLDRTTGAAAKFRQIMKRFKNNMHDNKSIDTDARREVSRLRALSKGMPADVQSAFDYARNILFLYI
jgi:hypothetical protein